MTARTVTLDDETRSASSGRWWQLLVGVLCMSMIANLQYGWTLFVNPISAKHGWGRAAIQVAFTLFVLPETWLVPIEGYLVDRFGPRIVVVLASLFVGIAWVMNAYASSLPALYVAAVIGGIGAGADFRAASGEGFELPVVQRAAGDGYVVAGIAILAVGEDLDELIAREFVGDGGEIERVAARRIVSGKRERSDGVEQVAAGAVLVARQKRDRNWHVNSRS